MTESAICKNTITALRPSQSNLPSCSTQRTFCSGNGLVTTKRSSLVKVWRRHRWRKRLETYMRRFVPEMLYWKSIVGCVNSAINKPWRDPSHHHPKVMELANPSHVSSFRCIVNSTARNQLHKIFTGESNPNKKISTVQVVPTDVSGDDGSTITSHVFHGAMLQCLRLLEHDNFGRFKRDVKGKEIWDDFQNTLHETRIMSTINVKRETVSKAETSSQHSHHT